MRKYYTLFDRDHNRVGFALAKPQGGSKGFKDNSNILLPWEINPSEDDPKSFRKTQARNSIETVKLETEQIDDNEVLERIKNYISGQRIEESDDWKLFYQGSR